MEHTCVTNTLKRMFCGVPSSDLSRNMDIAHRGVLMNLRCKAVFTAEIGQYSGIELSSRRSQIMRLCNLTLCYLTPSLFKYLHKTPYYREMLDRNIESEMYSPILYGIKDRKRQLVVHHDRLLLCVRVRVNAKICVFYANFESWTQK